MTPVASQRLAGPDLQPGGLNGGDAAAIGIENADLERHIRWYTDVDRTIGLHRCVAEDLAHEVAGTEGRTVQVENIAVGNRHRLLQADEAGRALRGGRCLRVGQSGNSTQRLCAVEAIKVINTADVEDAEAGVDQRLVDVHARD